MATFMTASEILNSMKGHIDVPYSELEQLFVASSSAINYLLNERSVVEIPDFGTFTRKVNNHVVSNSFKPNDRLKERINQR